MTTALRLLLAAVFAVAAGAKVLDRRSFQLALAEFGAPARSVPFLAWSVPAAEALVAAGLLIDATAVAAGALGALLLLAFAAAIARVLVRGERPDCNCFGQLGAAPVGWPLLVRNALLAAASALVIVAGPGGTIPAWPIAAVLAVTGGGLWRAARARPAGAPRVGDLAPPLRGRDAHGREASLDRLVAAGLPTAVVVVSDGCGPCRSLIPALEDWAGALEGRLALLAVDSAAAGLGIAATPSALIVGPDGRVESGVATGVAGVEALVRSRLVAHSREGEYSAGLPRA